MLPCWSCDPNLSNSFSLPRLLEAVYEIWLQSAKWFQRISRLKMLTDGWTTDGQTTDPAYPTNSQRPFGSGELKVQTTPICTYCKHNTLLLSNDPVLKDIQHHRLTRPLTPTLAHTPIVVYSYPYQELF